MFYDQRQDIFTGSDPAALRRVRGISASYGLTVNCRNTRPIGVATGMICGFAPSETLVIEGNDVTVRWYRDTREQLRLLGRDINRVLSGGFKPGDIVILGARRLANGSLRDGIPELPYKLVEGAGSALPPRAIAYSTEYAFKGLEADAVFIVDIDELVSPQAAGALYVGASRARTDLFLYLAESVRPEFEERARDLGRRLAETG